MNLCFLNDLRYRTDYVCKLKFLALKKTQSSVAKEKFSEFFFEKIAIFVTLQKITQLDFQCNVKRKYRNANLDKF